MYASIQAVANAGKYMEGVCKVPKRYLNFYNGLLVMNKRVVLTIGALIMPMSVQKPIYKCL
jgi:hypothetical protein